MPAVTSLATTLARKVAAAMSAQAPNGAEIAPVIRRSDHTDLQANGVLALAHRTGLEARPLAGAIAARLEPDAVLAQARVAGPGFLNLTLTDEALVAQLRDRLADDRLGIGRTELGVTTVIDYSQPNIAKEMHVGHLRSTVIGDALVRIFSHLGGTVLRQNHIGDWGTQFGMLIQHQLEQPAVADPTGIDGLGQLYRAARARFDADPLFADRARQRVAALQAGDEPTLACWREIVTASTVYFEEVYDRLGVRLRPSDVVGESFYNPMLADIANQLTATGVGELSAGALCVFFAGVAAPDGTPVPLIVRKSDGGFGYGATDLAALRHRVGALRADRILYVVDARQALHFRMVFDTARRMGWLGDDVEVVHVPFGTVLGPDGRPFKTRDGAPVRLVDLLDEAIAHAADVVRAKSPAAASPDELARVLGLGAVKYADLATNRTHDYVYDSQRMVALAGNTSVYLQYAHARVCSILARAGAQPAPPSAEEIVSPERILLLQLDAFDEALDEVRASLEPHRLCTYLYQTARAFTMFWDHVPVLRSVGGVRARRVELCRLTGETLRTGLDLLGIEAPYPL